MSMVQSVVHSPGVRSISSDQRTRSRLAERLATRIKPVDVPTPFCGVVIPDAETFELVGRLHAGPEELHSARPPFNQRATSDDLRYGCTRREFDHAALLTSDKWRFTLYTVIRNFRMHNPPHPGEVLREYLPEDMTVAVAAERLGVSRQTLSALLNGRSGVSADMALRLSKAMGTSADMWLSMQVAYDLWQARQSPPPKVKRIAA